VDRSAIREEIQRLVGNGTHLYRRELIARAEGDERKVIVAQLEKDPKNDQLLKAPDFGREYQRWYSPALRVVEQLLRDRHNEFRDLYRNDRRKQLDVETFGIADYIAGIQPVVGFAKDVSLNRALSCFKRQIDIVSTAEERIDSVLTDIGRTLHAEILDDELGVARNLLSAAHIRSAGVVAGVALEGHLKKLIADHQVTFRRTGTLSNLNNALKEAGVYDTPQWRTIQSLADIRNLCGHRAERLPERAEVEELIRGVERIVKTQF
jgi:hypothetical protein